MYVCTRVYKYKVATRAHVVVWTTAHSEPLQTQLVCYLCRKNGLVTLRVERSWPGFGQAFQVK